MKISLDFTKNNYTSLKNKIMKKTIIFIILILQIAIVHAQYIAYFQVDNDHIV